MANIYVGGATANDTNSGASWALAKATIAGALAIATTADTVVIDQDYSQAATAAVALTCPAATTGAAVRIETGAQTGSDPPVQFGTGADISTTGTTSSITITGNAWIIGLFLSTVGTSGNITIGAAASNDITMFDVSFTMAGAGGAQRLTLGTTVTGAPGSITVYRMAVIFGSTTQQLVLGQSKIRIHHLQYVGGSRLVAMCAQVTQRGLDAMLIECNLERLSQTGAILVMSTGTGKLTLVRTQMPAGWTGNLFSSAPTGRVSRVELHDCFDSNGTRFDIEEDSFGRGIMSSVHTRAGGRDRTALLLGRTNMCTYPACPFVYELEPLWNEVTGSEITVSVPVLADGAEPTDAEIAIRVTYIGERFTYGANTKVTVPSSFFGIMSTLYAAQELNTKYGTSSGWTTTFASPKPRRIDVPITPVEAGFIKVEVLVFAARFFAVDAPVIL
jgi:hypothetical protein